MLGNGSMKLTNQLGAGWGGEGFGRDVRHDDRGQLDRGRDEGATIRPSATRSSSCPKGPEGLGTLQYDGGWSLAAKSKNKDAAMSRDLVPHPDRSVEMGNAKAFGVMPSVMGDRRSG